MKIRWEEEEEEEEKEKAVVGKAKPKKPMLPSCLERPGRIFTRCQTVGERELAVRAGMWREVGTAGLNLLNPLPCPVGTSPRYIQAP